MSNESRFEIQINSQQFVSVALVLSRLLHFFIGRIYRKSSCKNIIAIFERGWCAGGADAARKAVVVLDAGYNMKLKAAFRHLSRMFQGLASSWVALADDCVFLG